LTDLLVTRTIDSLGPGPPALALATAGIVAPARPIAERCTGAAKGFG
jgi:hypothetical protein